MSSDGATIAKGSGLVSGDQTRATTGHEPRPSTGRTAPSSVVRGLLRRDELLSTLERAVAKKVTIVSAPAGSGKTSLFQSWSECSTTERRVAFVSVRRDESDAQQFWLAVLQAIYRATGTTDPGTFEAGGKPDTDVMIERVVCELADQPVPVVLIIDDVHELRSADALADLGRLLADLPDSAHVVLSTRRDPRLHLHKLRLDGEVSEIRASELQFSEEETRELLAASGITLSSRGVRTLHRRTEGWAAGLRLAALSLAHDDEPERFVAQFSGTDSAISEYLIAEMLERQPAKVQRLLLRTSYLDRINGELADLLCGTSGSERVLLALEDANAFVVSLDSDRTWFRYHHLLSDFLRLELRRTSPSEVREIHRQAASWFEGQELIVEAVRHTQAAGDWSKAAELLGDHVFGLALDGHETTIESLLAAFPNRMRTSQPELSLAYAATDLLQGRLDEAEARLAVTESRVEAAAPERRHRIDVGLSALRLEHARRSGNVNGVLGHVEFLKAPAPGDSNEQITLGLELRCVALMNLGIAELWSASLPDAEGHLLEAAVLARTIGRPRLELICRVHLGLPAALRSFADAREQSTEAVVLAERYGWENDPALTPALLTLAGIMIWNGEFDEGERWLRRAWIVDERHHEPAVEVLLQVLTSMLHCARGELEQALVTFEGAAQPQSALSSEHVNASQISGWQAATQARLGMLDAARATLAAIPTQRAQMGEIANAWAAIHLLEGDAAAAVSDLRPVLDESVPVIHAFTRVEAYLLAGHAHLQLGDNQSAAEATEAALAIAEPDRLIFPFVMTESLPLLEALARHETAHAALLTEIIDLLTGVASPTTIRQEDAVSLSDVDELTPSELRILRYLPTNLTRSEIARELYVSVNTVNTHCRNIYLKLGAQDRSAAVQRGRALRLLSTRPSRVSE